MKIAHIIWALGVGGSESMLVDIVNEQSKTEDVHLIIVNNVIAENLLENVSGRVKCHFVSRPPGSRNLFYILKFNLILLKLNPDVVHCHNEDLSKIAYFKKIIKPETCLTVHNTNVFPGNFKKFDKVFAISDTVKVDIFNNSGVTAKTIFNGIKTGNIKMKQNYSFKIFKIVQLGRLYKKQKGQDILLQALSVLINKYSIKDISVDFIGEGKSKKDLLEMAERLDINDYCNFAGSQDRADIYHSLKNYNLLVQPSLYEGFGLTVAEGMAAKVPVLVSDIEGPMEIIRNGELGYYFKSEDSQACADKIFEIMRDYESEEFFYKINNGSKYVEQKFSIKNTAKEYIKNY